MVDEEGGARPTLCCCVRIRLKRDHSVYEAKLCADLFSAVAAAARIFLYFALFDEFRRHFFNVFYIFQLLIMVVVFVEVDYRHIIQSYNTRDRSALLPNRCVC